MSAPSCGPHPILLCRSNIGAASHVRSGPMRTKRLSQNPNAAAYKGRPSGAAVTGGGLDGYARRPRESVFDELRSGPRGLTSDEAARRLSLYGRNVLPKQRFIAIRIFLRQLANPLLALLVGAT